MARDAVWERCHLHALFYDHIVGCGCNQPETAYNLVRNILNLAPFYTDGNWRKVETLIGSEGAFQIIVGLLSSLDLLEHGSSMGGSWITPKGEYVRELMGRHEWATTEYDSDGEPDGVDDAGYPECCHAETGCPPEHWLAPTATPKAAR
ncbi:MAG: hypothetical protein HOY79_17735 [Streptomyces sp.]|nr:hypothetical protein [Streptomyces sp.]